MALRCARGAIGPTPIRDGRRTVQLTAAGGLVYFFDPLVAFASAARCARLVAQAGSLEEANEVLLAHGITTELEWEAAQAPPAT